jgi:triosephosphate isomerase
MRQLVVGNWKMHGRLHGGLALARAIGAGSAGLSCDLLLCPPFPLLHPVAEALRGSGVGVGGQDCSPLPDGPHTGDVSAGMLADIGCGAVILGHSERREEHGETSHLVRAKAEAAIAAGLMPVVCVGETEADREADRHAEVVGAQVLDSLPDGFAGLVAYEPVWAIGSGRTPTTRDVETMHRFIRSMLLDRLGEAGAGIGILYGGSVKPSNAAALLSVPEVGGALVGGASLDAAAFLAIAAAALPLPAQDL